MANPPLGALGQASKPPAQKYDPDVTEAENIEETTTKSVNPMQSLLDVESQRKAMNDILLRLRAGLDDRKNRLFDPVMMKAASGFLKPTKTGSFGESLGYAAEGAGEASEKEQARQLEQQKLESELAAKEIEFRQQLSADQFANQLMTGSLGAGAVTKAPAGQGQPSQVLSAQSPQVQQIQSGLQGEIPVTDAMILAASRINPKLVPALNEMRKNQQEKVKNDIEQRKYEATTADVYIGQLGITVKMTPAEKTEYKKALDTYKITGDENALFKFYKDNNLLTPELLGSSGKPVVGATPPVAGGTPPIAGATPPAIGATPVAGATPSPIAVATPSAPSFAYPKTPEQKAVQQAVDIERDKERIKEDTGQRNEIILGKKTAQERRLAADSLYGYAYSDKTGRVFDLLSKPTVRNALADVMEGSNRIPVLGTAQIANIKKALLRVGATPEEQDAAIMSFRSGTMLNLQDTISLMSKQGAITEGERALIKNLNPDLFSDTRRTVLAKSQLVKARAEYDEHVNDVYEKWAEKNPNGTVRQFKQSSPEYQDAVKHYDNITYALAKKYFPDAVKAPSSGFGKQQAGRLESQIRN